MKLRNVNPLGYVDLPFIGRQGPAEDRTAGQGCLVPLEEFDVPDAVGEQLLAQVGNYQLVTSEELTVDELKAYAGTRDVDLSGASTKADILERIDEAHVEQAQPLVDLVERVAQVELDEPDEQVDAGELPTFLVSQTGAAPVIVDEA